MKNPAHWNHAGCDLDWQVAIAQTLLHNLRDLRARGLTSRHYDLMLLLRASPPGQCRTLAQLAARTHSAPAACALALRQLRRLGLVRSRSLAPNHPRSSPLTLKGEALLRRLSRRDRARWLRLAPSLLSSLRLPEDRP